MQKQLVMFPPTRDELLDQAQAEARLERALRDATKPGALSYEARRSRRKRDVRAVTVNVRRMSKRELELGRALYPAEEHDDVRRPKKREDCATIHRPCPFVACRHHLYLDVSARTGAIKLNFPDIEPDELPADRSCALDVAEQQGTTLEDVGTIMNLTRERIRQIEMRALSRAESTREAIVLRDFCADGHVRKRRLPMLKACHEAEDHDDHRPSDAGPDFDAEEFASEALDAK